MRVPSRCPLVAITMGDPAGVGPELVVRALGLPAVRDTCRPVIVGDARVLRDAAALVGSPLEFLPVADPCPVEGERVPVWQGAAPAASDFEPGRPQQQCGDAAYGYVVAAIDLARQRTVNAVVTAPISKEALWMAGHRYPGHTEIFAERTATRDFALMLASGGLRVVHATCHVSLGEAIRQLTARRVLAVLLLGADACKRLGVANPRIAVPGLNPHAGEGGLFGDEEASVLLPAIREARASGLEVSDPLPPDTAFLRAFSGEFDLAVAMYHDQGHIAFKLATFRASSGRVVGVGGVNVTLGLPIVRTSVDHGTAWDIAWKGLALPGSLVEAIEMAGALAG